MWFSTISGVIVDFWPWHSGSKIDCRSHRWSEQSCTWGVILYQNSSHYPIIDLQGKIMVENTILSLDLITISRNQTIKWIGTGWIFLWMILQQIPQVRSMESCKPTSTMRNVIKISIVVELWVVWEVVAAIVLEYIIVCERWKVTAQNQPQILNINNWFKLFHKKEMELDEEKSYICPFPCIAGIVRCHFRSVQIWSGSSKM